MVYRILITLATLGAFVSYREAAGGDWPRFRGPNGTGISTDKKVPVQWNETEGILWKTIIPGVGNSSPIVWGNRLFLQSATLDGTERMLLCVNVSDGRILWSRTAPGSRANINPRNTLASTTPATDGERVYAIFWDGSNILVSAYDFEGRSIWRRDLGEFKSEHGAGFSPIVYKGTVILANDQDASSTLIALRTTTGEIAWQTPRSAIVACYSTPFLLERPGRSTELIVGSTSGISGYDPETGSERWTWKWKFAGKSLRTVASPVYADGFLFLNSGDGGGERYMVALRLDETGGTIKPSLAWESARTFPYVPTMITWGKHLFWVSDLGIAGCYLAETGESLWIERMGGNISASPVLIDGKIYAVTEDGDAYVFAAERNFRLLAKNPIGELVRASPAVSGDRLYIRGANHLFCIGAAVKK